MAYFNKGDRVAWSQSVATSQAEGSIMLADAVSSADPDAKYGKVTGVANDEKTYFTVKLDGYDNEKTLTHEELVKVSNS
jgi:hypothetical protein